MHYSRMVFMHTTPSRTVYCMINLLGNHGLCYGFTVINLRGNLFLFTPLRYQLRPELLESLFVLHRVTKGRPR